MKKILPNIYKGIVRKNKNQKESIFEKVEKVPKINEEEKTVEGQINDIFTSSNYVYKADVVINTIDGKTLKKTIIGRTNNSLITMDDELIDVSKIEKIDFLS